MKKIDKNLQKKLLIFSGIVIAFLGIAFGYSNNVITWLSNTNLEFPTNTPNVIQKTPIIVDTETVKDIEDSNSNVTTYNFLVLGNDYQDDSPERYENTQQSDAIIIVNIQLKDNVTKITLVSLARELYIEKLYGRELNLKISQMWAAHSPIVLETYLSSIFDIEIDGTFATNMNLFPDFIDDIGGIDLMLTQPIYDTCGEVDYALEPGTYHFTGIETLCVARMRFTSPRGYFDRQELHTAILVAIWQEVGNGIKQDPMMPLQFYNTYSKYIETNIDINLVAELVFELLSNPTEYFHKSMQPEILELYPRPTSEAPYLYKMIVDPVTWWKEQVSH